MRIALFCLALLLLGAPTVTGNPKAPTAAQIKAAETKAKAETKAQTGAAAKAQQTATKAQADAEVKAKATAKAAPAAPSTKPPRTNSGQKTTQALTPASPAMALANSAQSIDAKFISRLPASATLPANTPKLGVKITINGTPTNVIAGQKLSTVLTALMALAATDATHANAGILTALNYALPIVKPGAPGKATTVPAALAAFKIARYIGIA